MKNIFRLLMITLVSSFALASCSDETVDLKPLEEVKTEQATEGDSSDQRNKPS